MQENLLTENLDYDKIDIDEVLNILNMKKSIQQAKALHPYEIHYTEKSGWFTVVDDDTVPTGKRKIRKCSEEKLWTALGEYYSHLDNKNITLEELYHAWITWKETPNNAATIKRLEKSWNAYYLNEPLSQTIIRKQISKITSLDLREWAELLMKKHLPNTKKFHRMFTIVNQCYEYASDEDRQIVSSNVWQKARKKLNKSLILPNPIPDDDTQVFSDEERKLLKQFVYEDLERFQAQSSTAGLQILFLLETGLRIGECCGLKWTDIKDNRLYIRRQADNDGVREKTKTASSYRDIPLTKEALRILDDIEKFNHEHGYNKEWIFQSCNADYDYRLSYNAADRKLRKLCTRLNTEMKSPHKCRKTVISTLLDSPDINNRTVQKFAGHSDIKITMEFYNFERRSKEEQATAIDKALSLD